jgi:hypothetical protein
MPREIDAKSKPTDRPSSRHGAARKPRAVGQREAAKVPAMAGPASKEELRAKVEKLERANAILRKKNKELRNVALETAEQVDGLTLQLAKSERQGGQQAGGKASADASEARGGAPARRGRRKARDLAADGGDRDNLASGSI